MKNHPSSQNKTIKVIRRIARILGLLLIILTLGFAIPQLMSEQEPTAEPRPIANILMGVIMLGGLGLAWKWELIGALISLAGFIGIGLLNPDALAMPMMYLFPITAILFLICWWLGKSQYAKEDNIG
jgi:hypothetical protein